MDLGLVFITGLTVGGLTCLAVQGGLLLSVISTNAGESRSIKNALVPTLSFLATKLIAYTILGGLLGLFGSVVGLSPELQVVMQFLAGVFMMGIALELLQVHPVFRYFVLQPPSFLTRKIRGVTKRHDIFAPAILGLMTIFIPCGTTLAMEAYAIGSGSVWYGASIMAMFILGTTPLFLGVGWVTAIFGENFRKGFQKIAAVIILYLGLVSIYGALVAAGYSIDLPFLNQTSQSAQFQSGDRGGAPAVSQDVDITIRSSGYYPGYFRVRNNQPVTVRLKAEDVYSCASAFRIPSLGVHVDLRPQQTYQFTFTPRSRGPIPFNCSMGMYAGIIEVQ